MAARIAPVRRNVRRAPRGPRSSFATAGTSTIHWPRSGQGMAGMTILGRHLLETGHLRDGIDLEEVRDVLWTYLAIDNYERLVLTQGWPPERYSRWLAHAITRASR